MAWLWSNPEPSNNTLPALQSQFKVDTPSISGLVAAILQERARAQKQKSDELNSLISGVGSVASGLYGGYEQNKSATDMSNYLQQARVAQQSGKPGGTSEARNETLQGMSPENRLKMMQWQFQQDKLNQSPRFYQDANGNTIYD